MAAFCWLCNQPVEDPPEIIGRWLAEGPRLVHKRCLQTLGELELDFQRADEGAAPGSPHDGSGAA